MANTLTTSFTKKMMNPNPSDLSSRMKLKNMLTRLLMITRITFGIKNHKQINLEQIRRFCKRTHNIQRLLLLDWNSSLCATCNFEIVYHCTIAIFPIWFVRLDSKFVNHVYRSIINKKFKRLTILIG